MDDHLLKTFLQLHLATDSSALLHLPYILQSLTPQTFNPPSAHTQKWTARINSLIHSKDSGARWAGLSIALRTSVLSKPLMIDCAQSWVGATLPMLSKNEPLPCLKACIRLVRYIFLNATTVPEFQRQVVTPNVAKFSQALLRLAEREGVGELKILCLTTLSYLVSTYSSSHRALHSSLSNLCLKFLHGSSPKPTPGNLVDAASQLYSSLPLSGGKVGASDLWRKSVDETISFTWDALTNLRTTFPREQRDTILQTSQNLGDPMVYIPLNLDRLWCGVIALCYLCRNPPPRPVRFPVGTFARLCIALLSSSADEQVQGYADPTVCLMEVSVIPTILSFGCELLSCLAKCARFHLTPHVTRFLSCITHQLETPSVQKLPFLRTIPVLLIHSHPLAAPNMPNRLIKAVLPSLTALLASESDVQHQNESSGMGGGKKKGKKRARGYEGDELFKIAREVVCPSEEGGEEVIAAVEAIQILLRDPEVVPAVHSLAFRVLLSLHLSLPRMPPALLSRNLALHGQLCAKVQDVCLELGSGNASVMSRSLILVAGIHGGNSNEKLVIANADAQARLDLLLHPRLPPLVRPMPPMETLSLFKSQESQDETELRKELGLEIVNGSDLGLGRTEPTPTEEPNPVHFEREPPSAPRRDIPIQEPQHHALYNAPPIALSSSQLQIPPQSPKTQPAQTPRPNDTKQSAMPTTYMGAVTGTASSSARQLPPEPGPSIRPIETEPATKIANLDEDEEMPSINLDSDSDQDQDQDMTCD